MSFIDQLHFRLLEEDSACPCKMFWCVPTPTDSNDISWDVMSFDSDSDDLSNWLIILHRLKKDWKKDFDVCKGSHSGLPRGILVDGHLYHGNNLPPTLDLPTVASKMGGSLGRDITPVYSSNYGINQEDLARIEELIGQELGLQYTD